jgi:hypothetical protein
MQVKEQLGNIYQNKTKVYLIFNEFDKVKSEQLKKACDNFVDSDKELHRAKENKILNYKIFQEDFAKLFPKCIKCINNYPSLVFLDQNGVKFTSDKYFMPLVKSKCTDFCILFHHPTLVDSVILMNSQNIFLMIKNVLKKNLQLGYIAIYWIN